MNSDWQTEVRALTGGHGVEQVLDIGGRDTLPKALEALTYGVSRAGFDYLRSGAFHGKIVIRL